jgi:H/ACA ribonucleoprotein complex subunit 3
MNNTVFLGNQRISLTPTKALAKGGEADLYLHQGSVLKVYKQPDHPDFSLRPLEQSAAKERIATQQKKLPLFPNNLPEKIIAPKALLWDQGKRNILGYAMDLELAPIGGKKAMSIW